MTRTTAAVLGVVMVLMSACSSTETTEMGLVEESPALADRPVSVRSRPSRLPRGADPLHPDRSRCRQHPEIHLTRLPGRPERLLLSCKHGEAGRRADGARKDPDAEYRGSGSGHAAVDWRRVLGPDGCRGGRDVSDGQAVDRPLRQEDLPGQRQRRLQPDLRVRRSAADEPAALGDGLRRCSTDPSAVGVSVIRRGPEYELVHLLRRRRAVLRTVGDGEPEQLSRH